MKKTVMALLLIISLLFCVNRGGVPVYANAENAGAAKTGADNADVAKTGADEFSAEDAGADKTAADVAREEQEETIGIISAMDNEIALLLKHAEIDHVDHLGNMDFHVGTLCGKNVVIVKAGVGKVRAAAGTATLLDTYKLSKVFFTGIAGGVGDDTDVLDVVVATDLVQHDYGEMTNDGFEWAKGYGGRDGYYSCDPDLVSLAYDSAVDVAGSENVFKGTIATGDQFIASENYVNILQDNFHAIACEMEGAAIAVVCSDYEMPFVVLRVMSDKADGLAHDTFENMADLAADRSSSIIMRMLENMDQK